MTAIPSERWPEIPGDPYPYGALCFILMLPGATDEGRKKAVAFLTAELSRYERGLGGWGLEIVREGHNPDTGRWEWLLDPKLKDDYTAKRMALVALRLRALENRMSGVA